MAKRYHLKVECHEEEQERERKTWWRKKKFFHILFAPWVVCVSSLDHLSAVMRERGKQFKYNMWGKRRRRLNLHGEALNFNLDVAPLTRQHPWLPEKDFSGHSWLSTLQYVKDAYTPSLPWYAMSTQVVHCRDIFFQKPKKKKCERKHITVKFNSLPIDFHP